MAEIRQDKQVEASTRMQRKPSQEALPKIDWLAVADLLVDYSYQHRPYASAIDALNKDYQEAYSGFILVNQRADGSLWILDGQTRYAVHQLLICGGSGQKCSTDSPRHKRQRCIYSNASMPTACQSISFWRNLWRGDPWPS